MAVNWLRMIPQIWSRFSGQRGFAPPPSPYGGYPPPHNPYQNPYGAQPPASYAPQPNPYTPASYGGASDYSPHAIASRLRGSLAGKAHEVIRAAQAYGLNPAYLAAVIGTESAFGGSRAATDGRFNYTGIMGNASRPVHAGHDSWSGLLASARLLRKFADKYGSSPAALWRIAQSYAPVGAHNDPGGTNGHWPRRTFEFFRGLGGGMSLLTSRAPPAVAHAPQPQQAAYHPQQAAYHPQPGYGQLRESYQPPSATWQDYRQVHQQPQPHIQGSPFAASQSQHPYYTRAPSGPSPGQGGARHVLNQAYAPRQAA